MPKGQHFTSDFQRRVAYGRQRMVHDFRRAHPSQAEYRLREACRMCGLQTVGYEIEAYDAEMNQGKGGILWYDVGVEVYGGVVYLDAAETRTDDHIRQRIKDKQAYCQRRVIPYFRIKTGSTMEMRAKIETALIQLAVRQSASELGRT